MPTTVSTFGVMPVAARPLTTWRSSQPPPAPIQCVTGFQIGSLAFSISTGIIRHAADRLNTRKRGRAIKGQLARPSCYESATSARFPSGRLSVWSRSCDCRNILAANPLVEIGEILVLQLPVFRHLLVELFAQ